MKHHRQSSYRQCRQGFLLVLFCAIWVIGAAPAWGYAEPNTLTGSGSCEYCHSTHQLYPDMDCDSCHGDADDAVGPDNGYEQNRFFGPHGGYMTTTSKCQNCHTVHKAPADAVLLLPAATIKATCETCHDGTGGWGVYGVVRARTDSDPGGGHRIDVTGAVPGGDPATGGSRSQIFSGMSGFLTCTDCHSPHGAEVVDPFLGDRLRIRRDHPAIRSSRLLRQKPTGATTGTTRYGSDWCLACHEGRSSGGMAMNHPVESSLVTTLSVPYDYDNVPVLTSEDPVGTTLVQTMGGIPTGALPHDWPAAPDAAGNRGYLMPYPRTAEQQGRGPICQQCHEDSRSSVGQLVGDGSVGDAAPAEADPDAVWWDSANSTWTADGAYDNPRFQNFPHETANSRMLVEEYDDLCLNCHPMSQLP